MDEAKLNEIRSYEKEAAQIVVDARESRDGILRDAREESRALYEKEKRRGREEAGKIAGLLREEGEAEAVKLAGGLAAEVEKIETLASANGEKAVRAVLKELFKSE